MCQFVHFEEILWGSLSPHPRGGSPLRHRTLSLPFVKKSATDEVKGFSSVSSILQKVGDILNSADLPSLVRVEAARMLETFSSGAGPRPDTQPQASGFLPWDLCASLPPTIGRKVHLWLDQMRPSSELVSRLCNRNSRPLLRPRGSSSRTSSCCSGLTCRPSWSGPSKGRRRS